MQTKLDNALQKPVNHLRFGLTNFFIYFFKNFNLEYINGEVLVIIIWDP